MAWVKGSITCIDCGKRTTEKYEFPATGKFAQRCKADQFALQKRYKAAVEANKQNGNGKSHKVAAKKSTRKVVAAKRPARKASSAKRSTRKATSARRTARKAR